MSFLRKFFGRSKQPSQREVQANKVCDLDSGYVFVDGGTQIGEHDAVLDDMLVSTTCRTRAEEDPAEVDVSAWEMARQWTANTKNKALSQAAVVTPAVNSKQQRLAHRVENIRKRSLPGLNVGKSGHKTSVVVDYVDTPMDEDIEYLYDDKWNRKSKVESRRDRNNRLGT
ncbi:uncharacterized protein LALA0_S10e04500g [Lachancea lanzarotensis]|uniref:LALA0S10e04500g1_1 n=1 Tax=Lachancea lanzarotensis TaxID=1245769 RepID=A0A0C7N1Y4_9SACH|nr:uncharacterized protein LALA0_S10e04500g [Lachancea lanzarotensis]CEP64189.1 LALA0S10e04500g1_1 [Lachancea lanzarotensis]